MLLAQPDYVAGNIGIFKPPLFFILTTTLKVVKNAHVHQRRWGKVLNYYFADGNIVNIQLFGDLF